MRDRAPRARAAGRRTGLIVGCLLVLCSAISTAYAAFTATTTSSSNAVTASSAFPRCYKSEVLADSPVGYWRLDETSGTSAADQVNSNTGTYTASPTLNQPGALAASSAKAVRLTRTSSQYVDVPDNNTLDNGDVVSLELWVKRSSTGTAQVLLDKGASSYRLQFNTANAVELSRAGTVITTSTIAITDTTTFHHIAATKNAGTVKLYIDGVDRTGTVSNQTLSSSGDPLRIGAVSPGAANYADGFIDEVAVFGTALSATRVRAHFQGGRCYADEPAADTPVARWRLAEPSGTTTALDTSGSYPGTYKGGYTHAVAGAITNDTNTATTFDGSSGYVEVPYAAALNPSTWTVEAWVYPTGGAGTSRSPLTSRSVGRGYMLYATPGDQWSIWCGLGNTYESATGSDIRLNAWAHVVGTYDGTNLRIYVNGLYYAEAQTSCVSNMTGPLRIGTGNSESTPNYYFPGTIDDVAIYSGALSAARISAHYVAGRAYRDVILDAASLPVSYWRLGEASGTSAADERSANTGTYVNNPTLGSSGAVAGDANTAATLNGSSHYVSVPDSASLDTGDVFTAELWIRRGSTGSAQQMITKGSGMYSVRFGSGGGVQLWPNPTVELSPIVTSTTAITDTVAFHHIAVTKNGATVKIYIDGVDRTGTVTNSTLANNNVALRIGTSSGGSSYTNGVVDEVAVYNVALSADVIKLHYDAGLLAPR